MQLFNGMEWKIHPNVSSDDLPCRSTVIGSMVYFIQFRLQYSHLWICSILWHHTQLHVEDITSFMYSMYLLCSSYIAIYCNNQIFVLSIIVICAVVTVLPVFEERCYFSFSANPHCT